MATIWTGEWPQKRFDYGGALGRGMSRGIPAGMAHGIEERRRGEDQEQRTMATVIEMFRSASPADREQLKKSPGWPKVLEQAKKLGIPTTPDGGFPVPEPSMQMREGREAAAFPGATFNASPQPGWDPSQPTINVPPGVGGYRSMQEARGAALRGAMTGETAYRGAMTKAIPQRLDIERGRLGVANKQLELANKQYEDNMAQWRALHNLQRELQGTKVGDGGKLSDKEKQLGQLFTAYNSEIKVIKQDLRRPLTMPDRVAAISQLIGKWKAIDHVLKKGVLAESAAVELAHTLKEEITNPKGLLYNVKYDPSPARLRIADELVDLITRDDFPPQTARNIALLLKAVGLEHTDEEGKLITPKKEGGGMFDWLGGGG